MDKVRYFTSDRKNASWKTQAGTSARVLDCSSVLSPNCFYFFVAVSTVVVIFENHKQTSSHVYKMAYKIKIHCVFFPICLFVVASTAMLSMLLCFLAKALSSKLYLALKYFLEFLKVIPFLYFLDRNLGAALLFNRLEKVNCGYFVWLLLFLPTSPNENWHKRKQSSNTIIKSILLLQFRKVYCVERSVHLCQMFSCSKAWPALYLCVVKFNRKKWNMSNS